MPPRPGAKQAVAAVAATLSAGAATASVAGSVQAAVGHSQYNKGEPFPARLSVNQKITGRDSTKGHPSHRDQPGRVRHHLSTGDALGIWFDNDADLVGEVLALTGLTGDEATPMAACARR